jgi:hypothetical protein
VLPESSPRVLKAYTISIVPKNGRPAAKSPQPVIEA